MKNGRVKNDLHILNELKTNIFFANFESRLKLVERIAECNKMSARVAGKSDPGDM